ncbi:hypothetical protein SUGI_1467240, partial [Cryptomeria japonica]
MIAVLLLELRLPKQPLMGAQFNCSHRLDRATHLTSTALRANEPSDRKEWVPAATSIDHAFHNRDLILQYSIDDAFHECFDSRQHQSADQQHPIALDILWGRGIDSIRNMPEGTRTPELELRPPRE